jgi:glycosyltransferase involved in cell wall biosynthesis
MTSICAHIVVKNEGNWIEYCLNSVVDHVNEMIIVDTGSIDGTRNKINKFIQEKSAQIPITYIKMRAFDPANMWSIRNEMLGKTTSDWILVVDGDEVWFSKPLLDLKMAISKCSQLKYVGFTFLNAVGDLSHWQDYSREKYSVLDQLGAITIKAIKLRGISLGVSGNYQAEGEGYVDGNGTPIKPTIFDTEIFNNGFIHLSNTARSSFPFGDLLIRYRWKKYVAQYDWIGTPPLPDAFYLKNINEGQMPYIQGVFLFWLLNCLSRLYRGLRNAR